MKRLHRIFLSLLAMTIAYSAHAADPFTVAGVPVAATGDTAIEAQTTALSSGQARAAEILLERVTLTGERSSKGLPDLDMETVAPLIRALEISNEKRSAGRYSGDVTIAFNPVRVQELLRTRGIKMIATQSRERLVLPVLDGQSLWSGHSWNYAMQNGAFAHSLTPLRAISADDGSRALIDNAQAQAVNMKALKALGARYGVAQILIAEASQGVAGVRVKLTDVALDTGKTQKLGTVRGADFTQAASAAVSKLESEWKYASVSLAENAVDMTVSVLYRSLNEWQTLQDVINGSAQIQDARLDALSKDGALMTLTYGGDMDRLRNELSFKGVNIRAHDKFGMVLTRTGYNPK